MKKIIFTLVFMLGIMLNVNAQYNKKSINHSVGPKIGLGITGSGLVFTAAGFLTPPDYTWIAAGSSGSYGSNAGQWKKKPFMEQGSRSMCIVTGITLTVSGLITMLANR